MAGDERIRQAVLGVAAVAGFGLVFLLLVMGTTLPGLAGAFFLRVAGIVTTPFFLEITLAASGLLLVILINYWRRYRDGDEFVYLDQVEDAPAGLPDHARWAVYQGKPLDGSDPSPADLLEGAVATGEHELALEILAAMDDRELALPEVVRQRIALARATGKEDLARRLESGDGR